MILAIIQTLIVFILMFITLALIALDLFGMYAMYLVAMAIIDEMIQIDKVQKQHKAMRKTTDKESVLFYW